MFLVISSVCVCINMCVCVCGGGWGVPCEARGVGSPRAGVVGGCEPHDMGTGNQTQVLCKSTECD